LSPASLAQGIPYRFISQSAWFPRQAAVLPEENAQALRHGPYPLPAANRRKGLLSQPHAQQQRPLLIGTTATLAARKRHEKLYTAIRASDPRKSLPQSKCFI